MKTQRLVILSMLAMTAFAANSLLCRLALKSTHIDAASFTTIRILSGAMTLWLIVRLRHNTSRADGNWFSACALFIYAAAFSFAYIGLPAGTGALLLFGAVQVTMIAYGLWTGERLKGWQRLGLVLATSGLVLFLLPGITAPPPSGAILMIIAGIAWGIYSLLGKGAKDPLEMTAGNFLRSAPLAIGLSVVMMPLMLLDLTGILLATLSGSIASGIGYAIWYQVLRITNTMNAAVMQLSVPVIAAMGGAAFLGEIITLRLLVASIAILGGIALVVIRKDTASHSMISRVK